MAYETSDCVDGVQAVGWQKHPLNITTCVQRIGISLVVTNPALLVKSNDTLTAVHEPIAAYCWRFE